MAFDSFPWRLRIHPST